MSALLYYKMYNFDFLNLRKCRLSLVFAVLCFALTASNQQNFATACSSRTVSKPRPSTSAAKSPATTALPRPTQPIIKTTTTTTTTTTTPRPNITFPTYKCPETYDTWYCLNEATCFSVKIGESVMYNCECANGFMGPRCEYKELDGSYLPKRPRPILEKASIASGATCALLFMLFVCLTLYLRYDHQRIKMSAAYNDYDDCDDDCLCNDDSKCADDVNCSDCCCCCCCGGERGEAIIAGANGCNGNGVGGGLFLRQNAVQKFPFGFAIKRSIKL